MKFLKLLPVTMLAAMMLAGCGGAANSKLGGNVTGLASNGKLILQNNGADALTVTSNGSFTFNSSLASSASYLVSVSQQPTSQTCSVTNGAGTVSSSGGNITNVQVSCVAGSATNSVVSVSISGLQSGSSVVLLDNGVDSLTITGTNSTAAGQTLTQVFPTPLAAGSNYSVTVGVPTSGQTCTVTNGIGQIPSTGSAAAAIVTCQ